MNTIGFTATRSGGSSTQLRELRRILTERFTPDAVFCHGDCIGGDAEGHDIAKAIGYDIHIFPPSISTYRAWKDDGAVIHRQGSYHARNQELVDRCQFLIVMPPGAQEDCPRSGTWMTYRMALRANRQHVVIPR